MRILIDTDVFCKLGIGGLLLDGVRVLGGALADCGRLAALPHMLRRGRLPRQYGLQACLELLPLAEQIPIIPTAGGTWLDRLAPVQAVDPGEAQLFALAAEQGLIVTTGDLNALRAVSGVAGFPEVLGGRIVSSTALLLALCNDLGSEQVRERLRPLVEIDKTIRVCFSEGNPDPREALESYCRSLDVELAPLVLWRGPGGGEG